MEENKLPDEPPPLADSKNDGGDDAPAPCSTTTTPASPFAVDLARILPEHFEATTEQLLADDQKLAEGIALAIEKGAVPPKEKLPLEPLTRVDVLGKAADEVALEIIASLGDAPSHGCVLVLQGLSGTGKGTTVAKLARLLPRAATWSNGNIFRALTLLAVTYCEARSIAFSADALTPSLLAELVK